MTDHYSYQPSVIQPSTVQLLVVHHDHYHAAIVSFQTLAESPQIYTL